MSRCGGGLGVFKHLWAECRGPFGVHIRIVVRGAGAQSGAMV